MNKSHHGTGSQPQPHHRKPGVFSDPKKWVLWVGVLLMLVAMVAYVLTLDESEVPAPLDEAPATGQP